MLCPTCKREMVPLFVSQACDPCDYGIPVEKLHRGFVVYSGDSHSPHEEYVFRTAIDAERWRIAAGREGCAIYKVYSIAPFQWHLSQGTLRDIVLADHVFEVFPTHRYEPLAHRCFIDSKQPIVPPVAIPVLDGQDDLPF